MSGPAGNQARVRPPSSVFRQLFISRRYSADVRHSDSTCLAVIHRVRADGLLRLAPGARTHAAALLSPEERR